ncbi:MAG: hypothetical protein WD534_00810 [Phycisphaeraceae bacterium]
MSRNWIVSVMLLLALTSPAAAQVFEGEWVQRTQQRIDRVRKTDVRVIVLDEHDRPAANAHVRIEQRRHDFPLGFTLHDAHWPEPDDAAPLWRVFNAVALDGWTQWSAYDEADDAERDAMGQVIRQARERGMFVRWGGGISADAARNPDWLAGQAPGDQLVAIDTHAGNLVRRYGWQVDQLDLYTHALDHDLIERKFGEPALRRLYEQAQADAAATGTVIGLRVTDRLTGDRLQDLVRAVTDWHHLFIPFDVVAIEQRVQGSLSHGLIERALAALGGLDIDLVLVDLEVGGASEAAAALNMETLLRTTFADPTVTGIWFGGMTPDAVGAAHGELFDEAGALTRAGRLVDQLFGELWWSDETLEPDELGNARARVFAGVYRITAVLEDGRTIDTTVHLPRQEDERIVVLQSSGD